MSNKKSLGDELSENKAVQAGGATLLAVGAAHVGASTGALGVVTATKLGVVLAGLGPVGLVAGGVLLVGGAAVTIANRKNKK